METQPQMDLARSSSSSGSSSSSSSGFTSSSNGSVPVAREVAESSSRSGGSRPTHDSEQVPEDMSWVSSALRGQQSVILKGNPEAARLTTQLANKGWKVVGMERGENIATWTDDVQFTMYRIVYDRMSIVPPFSPFQRRVLKFLQVAPSQLNPNAWAFLQGFEDVMKVFKRPYNINLFFTLLEMSYLYEQGSKGARKEAVSFKNRKQFNFFKPYMESLPTGWKKEFFWVVPYTDEAILGVAKISEDGSEANPRFPFSWSINHFKKKPGQYSFSAADLDDLDKETIRMLRRVASLVQGGRIKIKPIVDARSREQVKDVLGGWPPVDIYLCLYFLVILFLYGVLNSLFSLCSSNDVHE